MAVAIECLLELPRIGAIVASKYQITRALGQGGVGVVFEAEHVRMRRLVAVKFLQPRMVDVDGMVSRFEREARAMGRLRGPHSARVLDVDTLPSGIPYMVMEYLRGHDLGVELRQRGPLPVGEAVAYARQACLAMAEAHAEGVVHRDLKPANLFLAENGSGRMVKVLDFGISKIIGEDMDVTMTESSFGTPAYMSPEQIRSAKHVDYRTDIWSLGVILYRMLTGQFPFAAAGATGMAVAIVTEEPTPLREVRADVPEDVALLVRRALEKDPAKRFASVEEMAAALEPFATCLPEGLVTTSDSLLATGGRSSSFPSQSHVSHVSYRPPRVGATLDITRPSVPAARLSQPAPSDETAGAAHGAPPLAYDSVGVVTVGVTVCDEASHVNPVGRDAPRRERATPSRAWGWRGVAIGVVAALGATTLMVRSTMSSVSARTDNAAPVLAGAPLPPPRESQSASPDTLLLPIPLPVDAQAPPATPPRSSEASAAPVVSSRPGVPTVRSGAKHSSTTSYGTVASKPEPSPAQNPLHLLR